MEHRFKDELDRASTASVLPIVNHHLEVVDREEELALCQVSAWPSFVLYFGPEHIKDGLKTLEFLPKEPLAGVVSPCFQ
jgi:hypothetical protein